MPNRIIRSLHLTLSDGSEHTQGQTVDVPDDQVEALDAAGALVPEGFDSFDAFHEQMQDSYRSGRGDVLAGKRLEEARAGGIETLTDTPGAAATEQDVEQFATWLREEEPTVDQVVEMAHGDPARAQQLLQAESLATGQQPRAGVEKGLRKIIDGSGE